MKRLLSVFTVVTLGTLLLISISTIVIRYSVIRETEEEMALLKEQIAEQKIQNKEMQDLLAEENEADFYRALAEDMGYGQCGEKIYIDISGY